MDAATVDDAIWLALTLILAGVMTVTLLIWGRARATAPSRSAPPDPRRYSRR
jgi:hypothetical protein